MFTPAVFYRNGYPVSIQTVVTGHFGAAPRAVLPDPGPGRVRLHDLRRGVRHPQPTLGLDVRQIFTQVNTYYANDWTSIAFWKID